MLNATCCILLYSRFNFYATCCIIKAEKNKVALFMSLAHVLLTSLIEIDLDRANEVTQRCLQLIQNNPIQFNALSITLQASCGVSASKADVVSDKILQYADRALFLAKTSGFNQLRDERAIFS